MSRLRPVLVVLALVCLAWQSQRFTIGIAPSVTYRWMHRGAGTPFVDCLYGMARNDSIVVLMAVDPLGPGLCPRIPVPWVGTGVGLEDTTAPCSWSDSEKAGFAMTAEPYRLKWCGGDLWRKGEGRFTVMRKPQPQTRITGG